jgi:hypothetical protein
MSDVKHTPGPWYPGHLGSESKCQCTSVVSEAYFGSICQVSTNNGKTVSEGGNDAPPKNEAIANMHLIAASPDMLQALKSCAHVMHVSNPLLYANTVAAARAAIAKAEGRS